jgi:hypothetical protein
VLVNYWLVYAVGLCGWMVLLLLGLLDHGAVFHPSLRTLSRRQLRRREQLVTLFIALPVLVVCTILSVEGDAAVYFSEGTCHTRHAGYKLALAAWVAASCAAILGANRYLGKRSDSHLFNEYAALRDVGQCGVLVLLACGTIAVAGLLNLLFCGCTACACGRRCAGTKSMRGASSAPPPSTGSGWRT